MRAYIQSLQRQVEADNAVRDASPPAPIAKDVPPLTQQITELMRSLPPVLRDRPWSIADLVEKLAGKYRQRPHAQGVGQALRRLGWVRIRPGDANGGERRLWLSGENLGK